MDRTGAGGEQQADSGLAPPESCRTPDLSAAKPAPRIGEALLIVACLACDFLMVPVLALQTLPPGELDIAIALGIVGCVLAQGCLLAAWLAWSDGPFLRRLASHWSIAVGLYLIWLVGLILAVRDHEAPQFAFTVALGVPLVSLAAQLPLWVARQWFGWRLVREQADQAPPSEPPLAIRDLMLATLVVAVAFALARLAPLWRNASDRWGAFAIACAVASAISSFALLPAGALLLRPRRFNRGLAWSCLYAAAWIALVWMIVAILQWYAVMLPPRALFVGLSSLMFTFAATLMLTAAIARGCGYRLTGGRKPVSHE